MAAGDVTGFTWAKVGRARAGGPPFGPNDVGFEFCGSVQLDGANPTAVDVAALSGEIRKVLGAVVAFEGSSAPGVDPETVSAVANGGSLDVYAWKPTGAGDATLVASEDAARVVNFIGWGVARP